MLVDRAELEISSEDFTLETFFKQIRDALDEKNRGDIITISFPYMENCMGIYTPETFEEMQARIRMDIARKKNMKDREEASLKEEYETLKKIFG